MDFGVANWANNGLHLSETDGKRVYQDSTTAYVYQAFMSGHTAVSEECSPLHIKMV